MRATAFAIVVVLAGCSRGDSSTTTGAVAPPTAPDPEIIHSVTPPAPGPARPVPAHLTHVTIKAIGMNCPESCPISVRSALSSVPGIYEIGFDLDHESVFVSYDTELGAPKEFTRPMIAAIKSVGFDPWLAREDWPADAQAQVAVVP